MRIKLDQSGPTMISVLVYTYDPAEQALASAMDMWCEAILGEQCSTRRHNAERLGYPLPAHCDGFDLSGTSAALRLFLNSWRRYFDQHPDLDLVDYFVGRG